MVAGTYFIHGVCLKSNVSFPEFTPFPGGRPRISLCVKQPEPGGLGIISDKVLLLEGDYQGPDGNDRAFHMYGYSSHYVLSWEFLSDFLISRDGTRIECHPWADVPWSDIRQFLLGRVLPFALNLRGVVTLHGGAVLLPKGAVAFVANSGTGKSTLISTLNSYGFPIVSDGVIAVNDIEGEFHMFAGPPYVRLTQESLDHLMPHLPTSREVEPDYDKFKVSFLRDSQAVGTSPIPLQAVFLLDRSNEPDSPIHISTLPPMNALPTMFGRTTNIALLERSYLKQQFSFLSRLVGQVPVRRLEYPSWLDSIPDVCAAILDAQDESVVLTAGRL